MKQTQPIDPVLPIRDVQSITGLGRTSIYAGMQAGWFPRNIRLSPKRVAWRESEIRKYLDSRPTYGNKAA